MIQSLKMALKSISDDKGSPVKLSTLEEWSEEDGIGLVAPSTAATATVKHDSDSDEITVYDRMCNRYFIVMGCIAVGFCCGNQLKFKLPDEWNSSVDSSWILFLDRCSIWFVSGK